MKESTLQFGHERGLTGTVCQPSADAAATGVILFNAGVIHRIGPHRLNVRMARRLAAHGIPSIRFDLAGQGDSARDERFTSAAELIFASARAAMDALQSATGVQRILVFGFCSGAYHAFRFAERDTRIGGLIMFDAFAYPTWRSVAYRIYLRIRQRGLYATLGAVLGRLRRLARGACAAAGADVEDADITRGSLPARRDFARRANALAAQGIALHFIFAGQSHDYYNYAGQFRDSLRGYSLDPRISHAYFPDMDHLVTALDDQAALIDHVCAWILARSP
jgi:pimeloyl-ACP methyl ester carboxylesterase